VRRGSLFALAGISALALAVRLLGFEKAFVGGDDVVFVIGDPWYHLRLSLYAFTHFPGFLTWDPYLHHPLGAFVPWPPLFDLLLAGSARLVGASQHGLEVGAALWPPALGALTVLPVFALARSVGGVRPALGAAALFAVLPASVVVSRVGYTDHHVLVALLGATLLALQARALAAPAGGVALGTALALARAALVATWQGSLAYLGIAEVSLVLVAAAVGARRVLAVEAASLLASAALVAPLAPASARSVGGLFSTIELSWLHVAACVALAVFAGASAAWAALARSAATRVARALVCGALAAGALVAIPGVLQGRARAAEFLGKTDVWGTANPEQQPLFFFSGGTTWAEVLFGYLGYLAPILPVYLAWRARREARSAPLLLLACWTASFGALAMLQTRFANDLAPGASVGFALLLGEAGVWLARRLGIPGRAGAVAVGLGATLLALPLAREHGPRLRDTLAHLGGAGAGADRALRSPGGTLLRFARTVRAATPETSGFLDANARPEYGILSDPSLGHVLHYVARRATPSDNFGASFPQGLMATLRVLLALPEEPALATLRELQVRYLVTSWQQAYRPDSLLYQLHELDGLESDERRTLSHFRLVAEGPAGGVPLAALLAGSSAAQPVPYKLFEVVEGAVLEVETEPGTRVVASAEVVTEGGRRFRYRARGVADASGVARIRVPYASQGPPGPAHAPAGWRIEAGGRPRCAAVSEEAVRTGKVVRVAASALCP
jgi:dolichyl-diphosphooligosaccharide--protein glycosyltransferase